MDPFTAKLKEAKPNRLIELMLNARARAVAEAFSQGEQDTAKLDTVGIVAMVRELEYAGANES
jgi:hypothetical protein